MQRTLGPSQFSGIEASLSPNAVAPERSAARRTSAMPMQTIVGKTVLRLVTGDIAEQDTDAVVTAAHWRLNKGAGTDGTIHTKGGPKIYEECRKIGSCPIVVLYQREDERAYPLFAAAL